ncbi:G1/S-specific cyclin-E1 [Salmo salar]|uniref:G1/S-specific cyclin-E1 n=1 Tax=Salmo salar TaxID=8030 RepID=B9EMT5_SALSA|nr:G1/S-specific cyclin-E1 [Salmo salar]ACM08832.1 G1/S-specific cyclin-E1 [Salmo salar]|eukprot:NP_001140130.1 G1/S-specific cyclin-E1 [Salmo salar]
MEGYAWAIMPRKGTNVDSKSIDHEMPKETTVRSRKRKADVAIYLQDPDEVAEMIKKKQCGTQVSWNTESVFTSPCRRIPTPDNEVDQPVALNTAGFSAQYTFKNIFVTPTRSSPLPVLCWASRDDVWNNLLKEVSRYCRTGRNPWHYTNMGANAFSTCVQVFWC